MFRNCGCTTAKYLGRAVSVGRNSLGTSMPSLSLLQRLPSEKWHILVNRRYLASHPKANLFGALDQSNNMNERKEEDMSPEELEDYLKDNATMKKMDVESPNKEAKAEEEEVDPLDRFIREEMYPGLSDEVIQKLQDPGKGLPEGAFLEDLPLFPNPLDHSDDVDTEKDPDKIRTKPYDFNGADVRIETREYIRPITWEDEKLGPPRENSHVKLTVHVRQLGLPIVAAQKLVLMSGPRYNYNTDVLTLTSNRYATRKQNGRYLMDLLESLVEEAKKETTISTVPRRLPVKRGKYLPFTKDMLSSSTVKKQYEGMITEDE